MENKNRRTASIRAVYIVLIAVISFSALFVIDVLPVSANDNPKDLLSDNLFYNADHYNNDLALACATLCCNVDDISGYFPEGQSRQYTWDQDSRAFHVGIGYKTINTYGSPKNLLVIACRGTGGDSPFEILGDFFKDAKHKPFENQDALFAPYKYWESIERDVKHFTAEHPEIYDYPIVYLVTGHSLGGAAANLKGAQLTNENRSRGRDRVFVYTFGAIKAIASEENIERGYDNIFNIYNYNDTFGPHGGNAPMGVSDPYYKFGRTLLCWFRYEESSPTSLENHDMGHYRLAVENRTIDDAKVDKKAGILENGQRWALNLVILNIEGKGDLKKVGLGPGTDASWTNYKADIVSTDIQNGITSIGENIFFEFVKLRSVYIPASVRDIRRFAFRKCDSLKNVYYFGTQEQWDSINIDYGNDPLLKADLHCLKEGHTTKSKNSYDTRAMSAYQEFLTNKKVIPEEEVVEIKAFSLDDINNDGVPELCVYGDFNERTIKYVYAYIDGRVQNIDSASKYASYFGAREKGVFIRVWERWDRGEFNYVYIFDGSTLSYKLSREWWWNEDKKLFYDERDNEQTEINEDEFDRIYETYLGGCEPVLLFDTIYANTDENRKDVFSGVEVPFETADAKAWKEAYLQKIPEVVNEWNITSDTGEFYLVNIDNDDVPEVVIYSGYRAGSVIVLSWYNGECHAQRLDPYFDCIERSGLFSTGNCHMGYGFVEIYRLENGNCNKIAYGDYGVISDESWEKEPEYEYTWNDEPVSEAEFDRLYKEAYDYDMVEYEEAYTYGEINRAIQDYGVRAIKLTTADIENESD